MGIHRLKNERGSGATQARQRTAQADPDDGTAAAKKSFFGQLADEPGRVHAVMAEGSAPGMQTEVAGSEHYGAAYNDAKSRLALEAVTFQGEGYRSIRNDTNGDAYPFPHWETNRATHIVSSYPVLYVSGSQMEARVRFALEPSEIDTAIWVVGGGGGYAFIGGTNVSRLATNVEVTVLAHTNLPPQKVDFLKPLSISWTYAWANDPTNFQTAGTSTNWVYVTWNQPEYTDALYHTVVHLACSKTGGTDWGAVFANTWQNFASNNAPVNVTTWDGKTQLHYYKAGLAFPNATTSYSLLLSTNHNGRCGAWADLLGRALWANGHNGWQPATIYPPTDARYLMISNWTFGATNFSDPVFQWEDEVPKNTNGNPEMVPLSGVTGPVQPVDGVAGQNSPTPAEKIFTEHVVVRNNLDGKYYDPSYGKVYTSLADFQSQAIAGYAKPDPYFQGVSTMKILISQTNSTLGLPRFP